MWQRIDDWLDAFEDEGAKRIDNGRLVRTEPLQWCDAQSPKGRWRCIRAPHDNDNHVYAPRPS